MSKLTNSSSGIVIIRLMVGIIFLAEGIENSIFPETIMDDHFAQIDSHYSEFFTSFGGIFEIICSTLIIGGLLTRIATIPLLIVIITAIITTRIPIFIQKGFLVAIHEGKTDFCMFMGLIYLFIMGSGKWSFVYRILHRNKTS